MFQCLSRYRSLNGFFHSIFYQLIYTAAHEASDVRFHNSTITLEVFVIISLYIVCSVMTYSSFCENFTIHELQRQMNFKPFPLVILLLHTRSPTIWISPVEILLKRHHWTAN